MTGTIVNTLTIICGTIVGSIVHRGIKEKYKKVLYTGLGLASLGIGLNAFISNLGKSEYPVLFILSLSVGGVIGTALDIDGRFKRLVDRKSHTDESRSETLDSRNSSSKLSEGLSTAILLYCIGPLSMLGPIISAVNGDNTFLYTNSTLDMISSFVFATTYGIGMLLAAPVLFLWQGMFYLLGRFSSDALGPSLMSELLIIGGLMITASGLSLLELKDCKTLNYLPALLVPVVWQIFLSIF